MKSLIYALLILLVITSCSFQCGKDRDRYEEVLFEFEIPLNISPATDTVSVGQELTLTADFPDSLFDVLSQKKYYLPNFNFRNVGDMRQLTGITIKMLDQPGAMDSFEFTNNIGSISNKSSTFSDINFKYENGRYKLTIKIKPKNVGIYTFQLFHDPTYNKLPQELAPSGPGLKRFPRILYIRYRINDGNTHFNILEDNSLNTITSPDQRERYIPTTYTFVVK